MLFDNAAIAVQKPARHWQKPQHNSNKTSKMANKQTLLSSD
jgi:hypothetical protein